MAFRQRRRRSGFQRRRRYCRFCANSDLTIDYKDLKLLQKYMAERARILPSRISGNCARHQRQVQQAIKRARHLAMLPYTTD